MLKSISSSSKLLFHIMLPFLVVSMLSCNGPDLPDIPELPEDYVNFVSFSIIGPSVSGDFRIGENEAPSEGNSGTASASKLPFEEKIRITYSDIDQDIAAQILFPNKKGTWKIKDFFAGDSEGRLSVFVGASRIGESGTITISDIKFSEVDDDLKLSVKGSFEGIVENTDLNINQQFFHDITGIFEFDNY